MFYFKESLPAVLSISIKALWNKSVKYAKNTHCEKHVKYVILSSTMLCIHSNMMNNRCQKILAPFALQCSDTSPMFGIHSSCQMNSYLHLVSILKERRTPRLDCLINTIFSCVDCTIHYRALSTHIFFLLEQSVFVSVWRIINQNSHCVSLVYLLQLV